MDSWCELETHLRTHSAIDSTYQEMQILEKKHWNNVMKRFIAIVCYLAERNLAFRGHNSTLHEPNNGNFLGLVELLAEFDPEMSEHVRRAEKKEIADHYDVLHEVNHVSKLLQSPQVGIDVLRREVEYVLKFLKEYRENGLSSTQTDAGDIAEEIGMPMVFPTARIRKPKRQFQCESQKHSDRWLRRRSRADTGGGAWCGLARNRTTEVEKGVAGKNSASEKKKAGETSESGKKNIGETSPLARWAGIKNTVRLSVRDLKEGNGFSRETFIRKLLLDCCGFKVEDLYCVQDLAGYYDVTFWHAAGWQKSCECFSEKGSEAPLSLLKVQPLFADATQQERTVIQIFNPYVPVVDVLTFPVRYVERVGKCENVNDSLGVWTSKRQLRVKLRVDTSGCVIYPPSVFAIGGNRGFLVYAGQPKVYRNCGKAGHMAAQWKAVLCRNCKVEGHLNNDCTEAKSCNLCGQAGHLYRACPKRVGAYAQAATQQEIQKNPIKKRKTNTQ
ncbi:zinc finger CCHC domain-containing protein 3-like [Mobula hypostoma]|uniref:zinc finger CCHC domain-containing protein 3-like n=1 Tax=Mobula hypostoma TaxID=723540 RepID=UPI002FC3C4D7